MTSWYETDKIVSELVEKFPGMNVVTKKNDALLERIKTLSVYATLPALPDDAKEKMEIFYRIKQAYISAMATDKRPMSSVDPDCF